MSKVVFYCDLIGIAERKLDDLEFGNPGIGGTQYLFLYITKLLSEYYVDKNVEVVFCTNAQVYIDNSNIHFELVRDFGTCVRYCKDNNVNILVIREHETIIGKDYLNGIKFNVVVWAHNTINYNLQNLVARNRSIRKIVCVSQRQYDNMKDSLCFNKCVYINNWLPQQFITDSKKLMKNRTELTGTVMYIGALVPQKGAHNLLDIWSIVSKINPKLKLLIIGGERLRNRDSKLGPMGLAKIKYEKKLIRKLHKINNGSVKFLGILSWRKILPYMSETDIGIVNPSYFFRDETFCMSAIELECFGKPVISRYRGDGLLTTVKHNKTGFLERSNRQIAERVTSFYDNSVSWESFSNNAHNFASQFNSQKALQDWVSLINNILNSKPEFLNQNKIKFKISKDAWFLLHDLILLLINKIF